MPDDASERPTLPPAEPSDPSQDLPAREPISSLPGERSTLELIYDRVALLPELLDIQRKLFHEVQTFRYRLEQRLTAVERRVTRLETWAEDHGFNGGPVPGDGE